MLVITHHTRLPSARLVRLDGELDLFSALQLRRVLRDAVRAGCTTISIDVGRVAFVDGSALGLLERTFRDVRSSGAVIEVVNEPARFRWLVDMVGLRTTLSPPKPPRGRAW